MQHDIYTGFRNWGVRVFGGAIPPTPDSYLLSPSQGEALSKVAPLPRGLCRLASAQGLEFSLLPTPQHLQAQFPLTGRHPPSGFAPFPPTTGRYQLGGGHFGGTRPPAANPRPG